MPKRPFQNRRKASVWVPLLACLAVSSRRPALLGQPAVAPYAGFATAANWSPIAALLVRCFALSVCAALCVMTADAAADDASALVIGGCDLFDPETRAMLAQRTIVVKGDRIVAVAAPGEQVEIPAGATRIDGHGKFVLPGLIDAHVHLVHILDFANVSGDEVLPLYLAAGVTTVRSTGEEIVAATLIARDAARRPERSPRIFTCSPVLDADPPIHKDIGRAVRDPAEVPALIEEMKRWNATTIKVYARTKRPIGSAIIREGHRQGLFVTGHLIDYPAQEAVDDGIDCLEHITTVFDFVIPPEVAKQPGHRGAVDLNNSLCQGLIDQLLAHKTLVDPTLIVFRNMILLPDKPEIAEHPDNALVPQRLRAFWPVYLRRTGCPHGHELADREREMAKYRELTGILHRAGVPLLVGTDSPEPHVTPGFSMHQEMELLVASGLTSAQVLAAATLRNAQAVGQGHALGSIAPGKLADMVMLDANPLESIQNTRRIDVVVRGGIVCRPAELLALVPKE